MLVFADVVWIGSIENISCISNWLCNDRVLFETILKTWPIITVWVSLQNRPVAIEPPPASIVMVSLEGVLHLAFRMEYVHFTQIVTEVDALVRT